MDDLDHRLLLSLAKDVFDHEDGPLWHRNAELAAEKHGERCDRLWGELRRQLAARNEIDLPDIPPPIADQAFGIRLEFKRRLTEAMPDLIEQAIGEL
jgi:hypothetical protein